VASFLAYGPQPELEALEKLRKWLEQQGNQAEQPRIFGFNHPNPSPGSPNYGYEVWVMHLKELQPGQGAEIKDFPGGLYAVLYWDGSGDPNESIPAAWMELVKWRENSSYQEAGHQWLEEHLPGGAGSQGGFTLDLYMPIA